VATDREDAMPARNWLLWIVALILLLPVSFLIFNVVLSLIFSNVR
jgi:hypothetical protein